MLFSFCVQKQHNRWPFAVAKEKKSSTFQVHDSDTLSLVLGASCSFSYCVMGHDCHHWGWFVTTGAWLSHGAWMSPLGARLWPPGHDCHLNCHCRGTIVTTEAWLSPWCMIVTTGHDCHNDCPMVHDCHHDCHHGTWLSPWLSLRWMTAMMIVTMVHDCHHDCLHWGMIVTTGAWLSPWLSALGHDRRRVDFKCSLLQTSLLSLCFSCGEDFIGEYCQEDNPCINFCMNNGTCRVHHLDSSPRAECICPLGKFIVIIVIIIELISYIYE